jgi:hypothetical protein
LLLLQNKIFILHAQKKEDELSAQDLLFLCTADQNEKRIQTVKQKIA